VQVLLDELDWHVREHLRHLAAHFRQALGAQRRPVAQQARQKGRAVGDLEREAGQPADVAGAVEVEQGADLWLLRGRGFGGGLGWLGGRRPGWRVLLVVERLAAGGARCVLF